MNANSLPDVSLAEAADAVEALWARSGEAPHLRTLLEDHPHWSPADVRAALLVDQQFRSRTSQPWSTEDYLALVPLLAADDDLKLDLIHGEFRGRSRQGNPPNLEELTGRFPHLHERLNRQLEIASWFEDAKAGDAQAVDEDSADEADPAAVLFGDYELYDEIARGGMGVIYRARHRKLKRTVALKMIRPERLMRATDLRRFKNETQIIAQLAHPNIVDILNVDEVDGIHFFTMRMVGGRDLESRRAEYLDDLRLAARLMSAVASAIHYAHQHGVLHRDLKPSNVLVDDSGTPVVVDFGLACHLPDESVFSLSDEFQGTPAYAAPELLQVHSQPASVAADVYGLGAILYVLITGQPLFSGCNSLEVWDKIRESAPPLPRSLNAHVDRDLEAICLRSLAKNPASRYSNAAALAEDLDRYLAREPVAARPIGWWERRARWLRKHPVGPALAIAAAVVAFNEFGEVVPAAYDSLLKAVRPPYHAEDFQAIQLGPDRRKLTNPQAGLATDIEGPDPKALEIHSAPRLDSAQEAAEAVELYWMALLRDVPFSQFDIRPNVAQAADDGGNIRVVNDHGVVGEWKNRGSQESPFHRQAEFSARLCRVFG